MFRNLLFWLPDESAVLVISAVALALILGFVGIRSARSILTMVCVSLLLSPFLGALVDAMPSWLLILLTIVIGLSVLRSLSTAVIGRGATDAMVGDLAASAVRAALLLPFRLAFAIPRWFLSRPHY